MTAFRAFRARGALYARQMAANAANVACYAEQHCNASSDPRTNYSMAIVAPNASELTKGWARSYTRICSMVFGIRDAGIVIGGRGTYNLQFLRAPAVLLEPGFVSNPEFAAILRTGEGQDALARCLVRSIEETFAGGLVGLSVGHLYRGTGDKGAPVAQPDGLEDPAWDQEGEICDSVVEAAAVMLGGYSNA